MENAGYPVGKRSAVGKQLIRGTSVLQALCAAAALAALAVLPFSPLLSTLLPPAGGIPVSQASAKIPVGDSVSAMNEHEFRLAASSNEEAGSQQFGDLVFVDRTVEIGEHSFSANGKVRNRSSALLVNAQVTVTFLDWRGARIASRAYRVGTLSAGEEKPYSVRLEINPSLVGEYATALDWQYWQ